MVIIGDGCAHEFKAAAGCLGPVPTESSPDQEVAVLQSMRHG